MKSVPLLSQLFLVFTSKIASGVFSKKDHKRKYIRVLIKAKQRVKHKSAKKKFGVRWNFDQGFSTTVSEKEYQLLKQNNNYHIRLVPKVKLEGTLRCGSISDLPKEQTPWGVKAVCNESGLESASGGESIRVAILDTGVYINHVDLADNVELCKDFRQADSPVEKADFLDEHGHGTHAAGTVLANGGSDGLGIFGIAPGAKLWAYKVLGKNGTGYSDDIAYAIRHAADQAEEANTKVIISMSFGEVHKDPLISDAVSYAAEHGALVISGTETPALEASSKSDTSHKSKNSVSHTSLSSISSLKKNLNTSFEDDDLTMWAPSTAIESTWMNGGYQTLSGSSLAVPHISGLAAKIWSQEKDLSNHALRQKLQTLANEAYKEMPNAGEGHNCSYAFMK